MFMQVNAMRAHHLAGGGTITDHCPDNLPAASVTGGGVTLGGSVERGVSRWFKSGACSHRYLQLWSGAA
jgi:hypothetical protein